MIQGVTTILCSLDESSKVFLYFTLTHEVIKTKRTEATFPAVVFRNQIRTHYGTIVEHAVTGTDYVHR